jgi:hypothetical protein
VGVGDLSEPAEDWENEIWLPFLSTSEVNLPEVLKVYRSLEKNCSV